METPNAGRLFATPDQLRVTADIVREVANEVARSWSRLARRLREPDAIQTDDDSADELRARAVAVLEHVAASLSGDAAEGLPIAELDGFRAMTAYRAWGLLADCLLTAISPRLPDEWPARVGIDLQRRIGAAIGRATGLTTGALAEGLEADDLVGCARLGRAREDLLMAGERERTRIARDLHDALAQTLSAAHMQASFALGTLPAEAELARGELRRAQRLLGEAISQAREIIYDLRPAALERLGLVGALRDWTEQAFGAHEPVVSVTLEGPVDQLAPRVELALFRLLQEALSNARRHANAQTVVVPISVGEARVVAEVRDDGGGFDLEALEREPGSHFGLIFMRERAAALGGSVEIISAPGAGTAVTIELPR